MSLEMPQTLKRKETFYTSRSGKLDKMDKFLKTNKFLSLFKKK
jgi:hypothetical protein